MYMYLTLTDQRGYGGVRRSGVFVNNYRHAFNLAEQKHHRLRGDIELYSGIGSTRRSTILSYDELKRRAYDNPEGTIRDCI